MVNQIQVGLKDELTRAHSLQALKGKKGSLEMMQGAKAEDEVKGSKVVREKFMHVCPVSYNLGLENLTSQIEPPSPGVKSPCINGIYLLGSPALAEETPPAIPSPKVKNAETVKTFWQVDVGKLGEAIGSSRSGDTVTEIDAVPPLDAFYFLKSGRVHIIARIGS